MNQINRRQFVTSVGAATLLSGCATMPSEDRPVAVIGAGLAGLAATWELREAGIPVRLFESSARPGGRVWTDREHFDGGPAIDLGGMGAGQGYVNWIAYCERFGLEFAGPSPSGERPDSLLLLDGKRYRGAALRNDPSLWPVALSEAEKAVAPFGLLSSLLRPIAAEIGAVENVLQEKYAHYDGLSLAQFMRQSGASDAAIALVDHTLNYNSLASVSTLSALRDTARTMVGPAGPSLSIKNGNGRLPETMAARLATEISYRSTLEAITTSTEGLRLRLRTPTGAQNFATSRVVLAIPFTALRKVDINPPLPVARQRMIDTLPYTQVAKTFVQTRTKFWEQNDADFSALYSDTPYERVFNLSNDMQAGRGLLLNWINGAGLAEFQELSAEEHGERVVNWMKTVWPGNDDSFEKTLAINWGNTYAGGAYAHYAPGQLRKFATEIPKPIGSIHFAGEHTELIAPGLEGAVVSGKRAAVEVINAQVS